jgi:hypothetical protein
MTILLALLAAILGGVLGAIVGFFAVIALGTLTGADDTGGALAMGAAVTGMPVGAVIGAVLGCVLVIRARRGRSVPVATGEQAPSPGPMITVQGWISLALVAAILVGIGLWLFDDGSPPRFAERHRPVLEIEIRLPADDPGIDFALPRGTNLRSEFIFHGADGELARRAEGEMAILSSRHTMAYKTADRGVELWAGAGRLLIFDLDLAANPQAHDWTDWRPVSHVRAHSYGEDLPGPHEIWFRTRLSR